MDRLLPQATIETAVDFDRYVRFNETVESLFLEFKADLDKYAAQDRNLRREGQQEFCRDVAAFANAWGGCLLIGIEEGPGAVARVAVGVRGVDDFEGRRSWMDSAIRNFLVPNGVGARFHHFSVQGRTVVAVNIPPSETPVVVWNTDRTIEYFRRTNGGKGERLHPNEIEAHSMNSRRAGELAFRRVLGETKSERVVELASGVWMPNPRAMDPQPFVYLPANVATGETLVGEHDFGLTVSRADDRSPSRPVLRVPYGLVRESWTTTDGRMGLFLHVRVVQRGPRLTLEPF